MKNSLSGTQNNNGQNVFDLVPAEGRVPPGSSIDLTVTFAPDHPSDQYSDGVRIELFGKVARIFTFSWFQSKFCKRKRLISFDIVDEMIIDIQLFNSSQMLFILEKKK